MTLQGWTDVYLALSKSVGYWVIAYFLPIIFVGAFFLMNLTIAVIKSKYSEEHKQMKLGKSVKKKRKKHRKVKIDSEEDEDGGNKLTQENNEGNEEDLSPEQKKVLREKERINILLKRLEITLKQKELRDKLTSRDPTT